MAGRLPSGFQEVESISSSGSQYIDVNYVADSNTGCVLDFQYDSAGTSTCMLNAGNTYRVEYYTSPYYVQMLYYNGSTDNAQIKIGLSVGTRYVFTMNDASHNWYYDTTFIKTATPSQYSTTNIYLFAGRTNGGFATGTMYSCNISQAGETVRNLIPCYATETVTAYQGSTQTTASSGTIGLYDTVNSRFYINSGSGTFTKGSDVIAKNYTKIGGTAYEIDVGVCKVGGTAYSIISGKTLIGGTAKSIKIPHRLTPAGAVYYDGWVNSGDSYLFQRYDNTSPGSISAADNTTCITMTASGSFQSWGSSWNLVFNVPISSSATKLYIEAECVSGACYVQSIYLGATFVTSPTCIKVGTASTLASPSGIQLLELDISSVDKTTYKYVLFNWAVSNTTGGGVWNIYKVYTD